ncbi:hypothetical protein HYH03_011812 [Edaphochlamys debaryana]|uniref:Amino acid transporter transmembrane domain-containing protein n=1 Tax=Edaphochlamys debaryana TaxID=47281 RepID=A0A835XU08_9CHLO|nr:hypothetical protein HYH03_011812 [Edaphochlamys debaryana]|eukprot:KAG2489705.1 hypothetical protein HYH03_011812 [Edaphochlamys debaryana]
MAASAGHDDGPQRNFDDKEDDSSTSGVIMGRKTQMRKVEDGRTSTSQSTLNLVNCILGAGVLGYPFCFKSCGLLLGTVLMLVSVLASRFSYDLLLYCSQISNKRTYEEVAEQALGKAGRQIVELCTAALNMGCIVAYLNILADVLSSVAGTIIPPGAEPSRNAYILGVSLFGAFPVALWVRDHATIATFSMASVGFVILFAVVIMVFACTPAAAGVALSSVSLWDPEGLLVAFPVIVYSFTAHPYYLGIFQNLHTATHARMLRVTNLAMTVSSSLYWVVGVCGYLTFRNRTAGDILRNFGAANVDGLRGAYERAIKLCYGLSILGSIPLVILPFYSIMAPYVVGSGPTYDSGSGSAGGDKGLEIEPKIKRTSSCDSDSLLEAGRASLDCHSHASASGTGLGGDLRDRGTGHGGQGGGGGGTHGRRHNARPSSRRETAHEVDVVDLRLLTPADRGAPVGEEELPFSKHALIVTLVLGTSLASAIWLPNIEFIFGLTGATASVLLSYILPATAFIRLLDANPELLGGGKFKVMPESVKLEWLWRKRKAIALLCFGVVAGIACTDATLGSIKQEAAVVHLAQQLVAHEVVVAETAKVQQKARAAVTAVTAVEQAAKELGAAHVNANGTFTKLAAAAAQLDAIAAGSTAAAAGGGGGKGGKGGKGKGGDKGGEWGINTLVKEHKQHAAETKALREVEAVLADIKAEVRATAQGVAGVVAQLDAAMAQLAAQQQAQAQTTTAATGAVQTAQAQGGGGGAGGGAANATVAAGSGSAEAGGKAGAAATEVGAAGASPSPAKAAAGGGGGGGGGGTTARDRAADLAMELGKALGAYSDVAAPNATVAGKSLAQVRATALSTQAALNQTATVLERVSTAVAAAKKGGKQADEVKRAAVAAMQLALNATSASSLAMQLTGEALQRSAAEEASELLSMLVQVSHELEKTTSKVPKVKRDTGNTTATAATSASTASLSTSAASGTASGTAAAGGDAGAAAAAGAGKDKAEGAKATGGAGGDGKSTSTTAAAAAGDGRDKGKDGSAAAAGSGAGDTAAAAAGEIKAEKPPLSVADNEERAAAAAGQLEAVIKDLNTKIAAAGGGAVATAAADTATVAAKAAAVAAAAAAATAAAATGASGTVTQGGLVVAGGSTAATTSTGKDPTTSTVKTGGATASTDGHHHATAITLPAKTSTDATVGATTSLTVNATAAADASDTQLVGGSHSLNVSGIAAALQDAVELTKVQQTQALHEIEESLTKTDTKVAERVVDILKDFGESKKDTQAKEAKAQEAAAAGGVAGTGTTLAVLAAGGGEAAVVVAAAAAKGAEDAAKSAAAEGAADAAAGAALTEAAEEGEAVGPVVKVTEEGKLVQEDDGGDGIVGPVVKAQGSGEGEGEGKKAADGSSLSAAEAAAAAAFQEGKGTSLADSRDSGEGERSGSSGKADAAELVGGEGGGAGEEGRLHRKLGGRKGAQGKVAASAA